MPSVPTVAANTEPTMSSREVADLLETRHDSVKRTIERLAERGVITLPPLVETSFKDTLGKTQHSTEFQIGKRDSYIIVAQLSPEFTARLVDRWQELEADLSRPLPVSANLRETRQTFLEAARIAKIAGLSGNAAILSAADATKRLLGTDPLEIVGRTHLPAPTNDAMVNPTMIGKDIGVSAHMVNIHLEACGYQDVFRDDKNKLVYQPTAKGVEAGGRLVDTGKKSGGRMVQQLLWPTSMIERLRAEAFTPA